jgi:hypothetical protein
MLSYSFRKRVITIFAVLTALSTSACSLKGVATLPMQTVAGPESKTLLPQWLGTIAHVSLQGDIVATQLPSLTTSILGKPKNASAVYQLSGPDKQGRVAYVLEDEDKTLFSLNVISPGGHEKSLFTRSGAPLWDKSVGEQLSLSPSGGKIGLISHCHSTQMANPPALLWQGTLEIWKINGMKMKVRQQHILAADCGLSWFPDGRRLVYVELVNRAQVPNGSGFGRDIHWPEIPIVSVLDLVTGKRETLGVGWHPIVSLDGKSVVVQEWDNSLQRIDVASRHSVPIAVPGLWGRVVAVNGDNILYWGLPTTGTPNQFTKYNSPLSGPKQMMSIKAGVVVNREFQTVVPYADPRDMNSLSFGSK